MVVPPTDDAVQDGSKFCIGVTRGLPSVESTRHITIMIVETVHNPTTMRNSTQHFERMYIVRLKIQICRLGWEQ